MHCVTVACYYVQDYYNIICRELLEKVCQIANVLKSKGVKKEDRVAIYMPACPLAVTSMLACTRIGAVHRYKACMNCISGISSARSSGYCGHIKFCSNFMQCAVLKVCLGERGPKNTATQGEDCWRSVYLRKKQLALIH